MGVVSRLTVRSGYFFLKKLILAMNKITILVLSLIFTSVISRPDTFVVARLPDDFDLSKTENLSDAERLGFGLGAVEPESKTKGEDNTGGEAGEGLALLVRSWNC